MLATESSAKYPPIQTLAQLNERNRLFWEDRKRLLEDHMADAVLLDEALVDLSEETRYRVPVYFQQPLGHRLAQLSVRRQQHRAEVQNNQASEFGRKGGLAKKTDNLQKLILQLVERNSSIDLTSLLASIDGRCHEGVIEEVTADEVVFRGARDREVTVSMKALAGRLYRAKKLIATRKAARVD